MKITKQLSEDEFIIKLDNEIDDKNTHVTVAHDYVQFLKWGSISTDWKLKLPSLYGKYALCSNTLKIPIRMQIPIKMMGSVVMPMLNSRKEITPEHYNKYGCGELTVTFFNEDEKKMISFFNDDGSTETISVKLYQRIKGRKD